MLISLYRTKEVVSPIVRDWPWQEFVAELGPHQFHHASKLACPAFSPAELMPGKTRSKWNVARVHFGVIDLDHKTPEELETLHAELRKSGIAFALYSTWSHLSDEKDGLCAARLVVPFTRPVEGSEWAAFWPQFNSLFGTAGDEQCKDASRLYFLPAAPAGSEDDVIFESSEGTSIDVDALMVNATTNPAPAPSAGTETITIDHLIALQKRLNASKSARWDWLKPKLKALIAGQALAENGEQDTTLWRMAKDLVAQFPNADAASLAKHFVQSVAIMATGPHDDDWVLSKIERAQDEAQTVAAEKKDAAEDITKSQISTALGPDRSHPYTTEELHGFAEYHGVDPKKLRDLWIIQKDASYYVFVGGRYHGPRTRAEIKKAVQVDLAPASTAGVELKKLSIKLGEWIPKGEDELMQDYGSLADEVHVDLAAQVSRFDIANKTLIEAPCPLRPLKPEYSPEVEKWLSLFGGSSHGKLLDWVASVTYLDRPCAAIYVEGVKGAGKTLLADGLARLWSPTGATPIEDAMGSWNNTITKCPLILADEIVPRDYRGSARTAELRQFIQARTRTLRRKYLADAVFMGCVRLIMTANNRELLNSYEALTANDIAAIVDRVLHIEVKQPAADYLIGLAPAVLATFVKGDAIAKHALWLRDDHVVEGHHRFIIANDRDALHRSLTTNSGLRSSVCHYLLEYLLEPKMFDDQKTLLIRRYRGALLVNVRGLAKSWGLYGTNTLVAPPASLLSRAIAGLSTGERRNLRCGDKKQIRTWYHVIDIENLIAWAHEHGYADRATITEAVRGSTLLSDDTGPEAEVEHG